ncbi:MAG: hypothetical protein HRU09_17810 [Oligoflexales bacterium]|nr:hypothetical protein [Oligoflexales bacterium]
MRLLLLILFVTACGSSTYNLGRSNKAQDAIIAEPNFNDSQIEYSHPPEDEAKNPTRSDSSDKVVESVSERETILDPDAKLTEKNIPANDDNQDNSESDQEADMPVMIIGAFLVYCEEIDQALRCMAQMDDGMTMGEIRMLSLDGVAIPEERISISMFNEAESMIMIMIALDAPTPAKTEQELCEEQDGFFWSEADMLCIDETVQFNATLATAEPNTRIYPQETYTNTMLLSENSYIKYIDIFTDWFNKRPTNIRVYALVGNEKGELLGEQSFTSRSDTICGADFLSTCSFPEAPIARLVVELDTLKQASAVIIEIDGILGNASFAHVFDIMIRN